MRVLIVLALVAVTSAFTPRVQYFDDILVASRSEALSRCVANGHCIAHESQMVADMEDGYEGHHKCGYTWNRQGFPCHAHCLERNVEGNCVRGKSEIRCSTCPKQEKFGVYCRVQLPGEELPHPCQPHDLDYTEIFSLAGPFPNVNQAEMACQEHGSKLAYWNHVTTFADRYSIQFCQYHLVRELYAVYQFNCHHSGDVNYRVMDASSGGYPALCIGQRPHPYRNPCKDKFPTVGTNSVYCIDFENEEAGSDGQYIIIQERPPAEEETVSFEGNANDLFKWLEGFGERGQGYWLGLDTLSQMSEEHDCNLLVELWDHKDKYYWAMYDHFAVVGEDASDPPNAQCNKHKLIVSGYNKKSTAGDALLMVQANGYTEAGSYWSDLKHDCDRELKVDCALTYRSAWWFAGCTRAGLNGPNPDSEYYSPTSGICRYWAPINAGTGHCMRRTRMSMRCHDDGDN